MTQTENQTEHSSCGFRAVVDYDGGESLYLTWAGKHGTVGHLCGPSQ